MYAIDGATLRATPVGSLPALLVQQSATSFALATWPGLAWYDEYLVPSLGGNSNVWTFFLPLEIDNGSFVVWGGTGATLPIARANPASNLPDLLRSETGLPIETLAKAVGVSKVTYHKWLNGAGISEESYERLLDVRNLLAAVIDMKPALRAFLHSPTPIGTPLELLSQKMDAAVLGFAARGEVAFTGPQAASPEGLHTVRRIGWSQSVDRDRLEDAYPEAAFEEDAIAGDESEPTVFACVLFQR
jgi:DNA-binding XRE family transcriptional regulator